MRYEFEVPLGYSPLYAEGPTAANLRSCLGNFRTIAFQTFQFGPQVFEVKIIRNWESSTSEMVVAGIVGKKMCLPGGQFLQVLGIDEGSMVALAINSDN